MKREILFRGKHICDNLWVYGSLLYSASEDQYYIVENDGEELSYPVREKTIGQYIGLKDKNGIKIFEGDIVKESYDGGGERIYEVVFYNGGFKMKSKECYIAYNYSIHGEHLDFEVIGDVYNNPELIKSEV